MAQQSAIKPVLQALVLADHVYTDRSGKHIIAGTFNNLRSSKFPTTFERPTFAFCCLTEVYGTVAIRFRYVDLKTNEVLLQTRKLEVMATDPLSNVEVIMEVPPLPMPYEGTFAFEVHAEDDLVGFLRVAVTRFEESKGSEQ